MMDLFTADGLRDLLLRLPGLLWALSFHEFCHGWAAYKLGDKTAAHQGRLSLNPLSHLDPIGTLMLLFFRFGWAKPVPINSRYFKNPRRDIAIVSIAGALGNFLTAFVCGRLIILLPQFFANGILGMIMFQTVMINIGLGVFNLVPIPPLDGSKLLAVMLPPAQMRIFFFLEQYGMIIILLLAASGILGSIMHPIMVTLFRLVLL